MELLQTLGIDWKLLIAQVVNFTILLLVLWKVVYKPLSTLMSERTEKIQKGLDDAKKMDEQRTAWNREHQQMMVTARKEAQDIVAAAQTQSAALVAEARTQAQEKIVTMMDEAKKTMKHEHSMAMGELEKNMTRLVVDVAGQFLTKKMNAKDDEAMIERLVEAEQRGSTRG